MCLRVNELHFERHKGHEAEASSAPHISHISYLQTSDTEMRRRRSGQGTIHGYLQDLRV